MVGKSIMRIDKDIAVNDNLKRPVNYNCYNLNLEEICCISKLAEEALKKFDNVNSQEFLSEYHSFTEKLPLNLRTFIKSLKHKPYDYILINNLPLKDELLEDTPIHWNVPKGEYTKLFQFINFIITSTLGYLYSWRTQQNGSMVADVLPIKGFEYYQQGFGSVAGLTFHTEDPFHIAAADFISLMCMRNLTNTATTLFPVNLTAIPNHIKRELFKVQFEIIPDESHTNLTYDNNNIGEDQKISFKEFNQVKKIAILYGTCENPYLRIDPEIILSSKLSQEAKIAYDYICQAIQRSKIEVSLVQGQIIIINNHRLANGRKPLKAEYNGKDRWLERVLVLEDIRKTINYRTSESSNVIIR